jgi:hypothetical protein
MAFRHYIETADSFVPTTALAWTEYDLVANGIPPSAVVEIAINNLTLANPSFGGVRATSGTLDRRIDIVRSVDGDSFCTMHVQADAEGKIEYYAESTSNIQFDIIGYWVGCEYFERFDSFSPSNSGVWESKALDVYTVSSGQIVDILITNTDNSLAREVGVRASGSTRDRKFDLSECGNLGESCLTQWVQASGATAAIQVYVEENTDSNVYILGYLNIPPGDYTELDASFPEPTTDATWEAIDIGASGVPNNAVAGFQMGQNINDDQFIGVRNTSSSDERRVQLEESFSNNGLSWVGMHVNVDTSGYVEHYAFDISPDEPQFIITNYWDNFTNSSEPFPQNASSDLFIEGRNPFIHYVEADSTVFNVSSTGSWVTYDLSANRNIPVSTDAEPIVAEILITNQNTVTSYSGGARSVGSSNDRMFGLPLTAGGLDIVSILVPVDSFGNIEIWANHIASLDFYLLGYWRGGVYVEEYDVFQSDTDNTWINYDLGSDYADTVAEIVISNTNTTVMQSGGVRGVGSASGRAFAICPGKTDYPDHTTMHVNTSGANGTIQIFASTSGDIVFTSIGRWSSPPGTYNEVFAEAADTTSNNVWQAKDIGVSGGAIVEMVAEHRDINSSWVFGLREVGSLFDADKLYALRETTVTSDTSADMYRSFINVTSGTHIELRTSFLAEAHQFTKIGYWDLLNLIPTEISGNITMYISGIPAVISDNRDLYMSGSLFSTEIANANLFMQGPIQITEQDTLFVHGRDTSDSSGNYPSGVQFYTDGHEFASGTTSLYTIGPIPFSNAMTMFIGAGGFGDRDLFTWGFRTKAKGPAAYVKGPEFITTSGDFVWPLPDSSIFLTPSGGQSPDHFIKGPESIISSGDFAYPFPDPSVFLTPSGGKSPDLHMEAHLPFSGQAALYIGPIPARESWTFFLKSENDAITKSTNIFIHGFSGASGVSQVFRSANLYLEAIDANSPYTGGGTRNWTMFLKTQSGNLTNNENWTMFLKADSTTTNSFDLVTYGHASGSPPHGNEFAGSGNLVCSVDPDDPGRIGYIPFSTHADPWTLFLRVDPGHFGIVDMYISGATPIPLLASGNLFVRGLFEQETDSVSLYLMGVSGLFNNGPNGLSLFLNAVTGVYNTSGNLYAHGF